jgi:hypothetical protein
VSTQDGAVLVAKKIPEDAVMADQASKSHAHEEVEKAENAASNIAYA